MKKNISQKQMFALIMVFILGTSVITEGPHKLKQNTWMALALAFAAALPMYFIYSRILTLANGKSLYEACDVWLGKVVSKVMIVLFLLYFLNIALFVVEIFLRFYEVVMSYQAPRFLVALPICLLAAYAAKQHPAKIGIIVLIIFVLVVAYIIVGIIVAIPAYNANNFNASLKVEPSLLFDEALTYFSIPLTQVTVLLCILGKIDKPTKKTKWIFIFSCLTAALIIFSNLIKTVAILGGESIGALHFASYIAAGVVRSNPVIQRIDIFLLASFLVTMFVKLTMYLYAVKSGFTFLFPKLNRNIFLAVVCLVIAATAPLIFSTLEDSFMWTRYSRVYATVFQVLFPIIIWIAGEVRHKKAKKFAPEAELNSTTA